MSGVIYGYISLTEKPVAKETLETMRKANSFWDPDGDEHWCDEFAGLGSLIMFNTPEAILEKQPVVLNEGREIMVANARIDNRDDLCREFNIPLSVRDYYPDSYYMRMAYEKWGDQCPDHLIGDWSMAVYNNVTRKLFIARDHHGIMACYYYKGTDFFVFSSSLKGILALPQVPKKENEFKIAQILVNVNDGGPQTCYLDIMRLPPAHTLTLESSNISTRQFWFLEKVPKIRFKTDQEYVDKFRELYTEAVRCRLRSYRPVGATLSGGLDSGSVCILAAQELAKYGKRLPAFTAVPLYDVPWPKNRIGDEGPLAQTLAEKLGNVDVTLCKAENISPLEGIDIMMEVHDQPGFRLANAYWIIDILKKCQNHNLGNIFTGQGGNATVSWPTPNLINKNKQLLKNIFKGLLLKIFFIFKNLKKQNILTDSYYNSLNLSYEIKKSITILPRISQKKRIDLINPGKNSSGERWYENGVFFKLEIRDPTIDVRLLHYLIGIPSNKQFKNHRLLFNKIFQIFFPSKLIYVMEKGIQSVDINERISKISENELYTIINSQSFKRSIFFKHLNINRNLKDKKNILIYRLLQKQQEIHSNI